MVEEARAYRERVLGELARRRDLARQQIEQLIHGRDRLLQAFERARLVAVDVVAELTPLGEPDEYVNLSPTTGPVPMMVPDVAPRRRLVDRRRRARAARRGRRRRPTPTAADAAAASTSRSPPRRTPSIAVTDEAADARRPIRAPRHRRPHRCRRRRCSPFPDAARRANDRADRRRRRDDDDAGGPAPADELDDGRRPPTTSIDRRTTTSRPTRRRRPVRPAARRTRGGRRSRRRRRRHRRRRPTRRAERRSSARDEALTPLIVASARKLKRVLADEQNEVLDRLRRREPVRSLDDLADRRRPPERHATSTPSPPSCSPPPRPAPTRWAARCSTSSSRPAVATACWHRCAESLADDLVGAAARAPRQRASPPATATTTPITKSVRAVYREWKTQRIDDQLDDLFRLAYGRGVVRRADAGDAVPWVVDPTVRLLRTARTTRCRAPSRPASAFPTGHTRAPAHPGCRCLLARADG